MNPSSNKRNRRGWNSLHLWRN